MKVAILIPAYKPDKKMISLLKSLADKSTGKIIVINDGSGQDYNKLFSEASAIKNTLVIHHTQNKGKGAALKTGFEHFLNELPDHGHIVTADADGQHKPEDIIKVAQSAQQFPEAIIIGARAFDKDVPMRSMLGNRLTRFLFKIMYKVNITDTQTGLRGIPRSVLPSFIKIPYDRYEYETEMLIMSAKNKITLKEVQIETVYENNNSSSHFNPLKDSFKIYFVLFRYTLASLASFVVDYLIFISIFSLSHSIIISTYAARAVSLFVNYGLVRNKVFYNQDRVTKTFFKYLGLVIVSATVSSLLVTFIHGQTGLAVNLAKIVVESILYFANFIIQKTVIFRQKAPISLVISEISENVEELEIKRK